MSEFEEKLNAILSNPDAMAQVASLAQSLGGGSTSGGDTGRGGETAHGEEPAPSGDGDRAGPRDPSGSPLPDMEGLSSLLGQIDPAMIRRLLPLAGELNRPENTQRQQLLYALRPYLKESRREKVDQALQVARVLHLGKKFLGTLGDGHV